MANARVNNPPAPSGVLQAAATFVKWLVEPLAAADEKQRRHLRLLAAFLLIMAVNSIIGGFVIAADHVGTSGNIMRLTGHIAGVGLFIGYIFSRTRYYGVGTAIAVIIPASPIVITILLRSEPEQISEQLPWVILPLLICSLLLSLRLTMIISTIYLALIFILTVWAGVPMIEIIEALAYIAMIITFVIVVTTVRNTDQREIERQLREREQAEAALRESEEKFSSAFKTSPNAICIVSIADGNFIEVNDSFSRFIGYPIKEIIGHSHIELALFLSEDELNRMANGLQENRRIYNQEFQSRRKSGEIRHGLFSAEVINIGGKPCVIFNIADITDQKRAERLQKEENRILMLLSRGADLKELLEAILHMAEQSDPSIKGSVLLVDPAKGMLVQAAGPSLSAEFKQLLTNGLPIGEGFGACRTAAYRKERVIVPDISRSQLFREDMVKIARRNEIRSCWSQPIISSKGEMLGTITNYSSKVGEPGDRNLAILERSAQIAAIAIERRRSQEALIESEQKFSKAFYASPDIIVISTLKDGKFIEVNDSFVRVSGYTYEDVINHSVDEFGMWMNADDHTRITRIIKEKGRVCNEEVKFRKKSGEMRIGSYSSEIINISGEPCMITVATDITERKQAEEELKKTMSGLEKSSAQLEATNRELETFSYSVSHDLRTPLRSIDGFSQALLEDYSDSLDEQGKDYLNRLRLASQKMGALIDGLLKLSRLTRSEMHQENVDVSALAQEIVQELREAHPDHEVEFSAGSGLTARGDPQLLRVLLENLIGNAWKFSGNNPHARIVFGNERKNGKTEFFVRDNGIGFDMAYAGKLFGAFQRLHSPEEFPGTGIGLATVQRIINRHGGTIRAESTPGRGTAIKFTLPQAAKAKKNGRLVGSRY